MSEGLEVWEAEATTNGEGMPTVDTDLASEHMLSAYVSALRRYPSNATSSVAESISTDNEMTYLMKGKNDEDREEETVDQADVDSVPDWLVRTLCMSSSSTKNETLDSMNRKRISFGLLAAAILTGMVLFTLFMDLYFMFALGEDIVDE